MDPISSSETILLSALGCLMFVIHGPFTAVVSVLGMYFQLKSDPARPNASQVSPSVPSSSPNTTQQEVIPVEQVAANVRQQTVTRARQEADEIVTTARHHAVEIITTAGQQLITAARQHITTNARQEADEGDADDIMTTARQQAVEIITIAGQQVEDIIAGARQEITSAPNSSEEDYESADDELSSDEQNPSQQRRRRRSCTIADITIAEMAKRRLVMRDPDDGNAGNREPTCGVCLDKVGRVHNHSIVLDCGCGNSMCLQCANQCDTTRCPYCRKTVTGGCIVRIRD